MTRFLPASLLALAALPSAAFAYGGGGVTVHQANVPWDVPGQRGANVLGCVGGVGYGVTPKGKRLGADGHLCNGPYSNMAMGGAQFGLQSKRGGFWLTGFNTIGGGWIGVQGQTSDTGRFDGVFVYTRPAVGAGFALGHWAALEGNVYAMLPLNVVGVAGRGMDPQFSFPHAGLQATLMFGDFSRRGKRHRDEHIEMERPPPPPPRAAPPAAPQSAPAGPLRPGDLPPAGGEPPPPPPSDDRPLAIPA